MVHLPVIGLLTFELLTLTAAFFLKIYTDRYPSGKWYRHFSSVTLVILLVLLAATIIHGVVHPAHPEHNAQLHCNRIEQHAAH